MTALEVQKKHGGPGRGQGRKPADGEHEKDRKHILMSQDAQVIAQELGKGNLSLGVAIALRHARNSGLTKPTPETE